MSCQPENCRQCRDQRPIHPCYQFDHRCEDCWAFDQLRYHGRSQRVELERLHGGDILRALWDKAREKPPVYELPPEEDQPC